MKVGTLTPTTRVENEECVYCFNDYDGEEGVNICMQCFTCFCNKHAMKHFQKTSHSTFFNRRRITSVSEKEATKLGIGCENGFDDVKYSYEYQIRMFTESSYEVLPLELFEDDEEVSALIEKLKNKPSISTSDMVDSWDLKVEECPHVKNLVQENKRASEVCMKCDECDLSNNLWLCLTCGHVGCGRKNFDGTGGNNHALDHFSKEHHGVAVKLGTISQDGSADLFCYHCDETVTDPKIAEHLKTFGIDVASSQKTESTTTELAISMNKDWDFNMIKSDGKEFETPEPPFSTGLRNLGNTCYFNSIIQLLSHIPEFVNDFLPKEVAENKWSEPSVQFHRLFKAMKNGKRKSVSPRILRSVVCAGNPQFMSGRQQDAVEFFSYLYNFIKVHFPKSSLLKSEFDSVQIIQCPECNNTSTIPLKDQPFLILTPPYNLSDEELTINIEELLKINLIHEIDDKKCDKCNHLGTLSLQQFKNFPDYLFIAVNLDAPNNQGMIVKMKINVKLDPDNLDLTEYLCNIKESVDEEKVNQLMNFGFSRAQCVRALQNVGSIDEAIDWIIANPMEQSPAVKQVMEMGFTEAEAREALEESSGNVGFAIEWLFGPRKKKSVVEKTNGKGVYELVGFVQHKGPSASCGHYISVVKQNGNWILYNDEKVGIYPPETPPEFGKGYIYLYRRKQ